MKRHKRFKTIHILLAAASAGCLAGVLTLALPSPIQLTRPPSAVTGRAPITGKVIKVTDGDTITIRSGTDNIKIRLAEIDAPERGQPWGEKSRQVLDGLVAGKIVQAIPITTDRYGRTVARVMVDGTNVNREMVAIGAAWAYRDYVRDPSINSLETNAKTRAQGLWALDETARIAPWDYRARRRETAAMTSR